MPEQSIMAPEQLERLVDTYRMQLKSAKLDARSAQRLLELPKTAQAEFIESGRVPWANVGEESFNVAFDYDPFKELRDRVCAKTEGQANCAMIPRYFDLLELSDRAWRNGHRAYHVQIASQAYWLGFQYVEKELRYARYAFCDVWTLLAFFKQHPDSVPFSDDGSLGCEPLRDEDGVFLCVAISKLKNGELRFDTGRMMLTERGSPHRLKLLVQKINQ